MRLTFLCVVAGSHSNICLPRWSAYQARLNQARSNQAQSNGRANDGGDEMRRDAFFRLLGFFRPFFKRVILCALLIGAAEGLRFYFVWLTQHLLRPLIEQGVTTVSDPLVGIVQRGLQGLFHANPSRLTLLAAVCLVGIVVAAMRSFLSFAHSFLANGIAQKVVLHVRRHLYAHLQQMPPSFFERETSGRLLARVINDVAVLQNLVTVGIEDLVSTPTLLIGSLLLMLVLSPTLTLIALLLLPLIGWLLWLAGRRLRRASYETQVALSHLTALLRESLSAIKLIQAFTAEEQALHQFDRRNRQVYDHTLRGIRVRTMLAPRRGTHRHDWRHLRCVSGRMVCRARFFASRKPRRLSWSTSTPSKQFASPDPHPIGAGASGRGSRTPLSNLGHSTRNPRRTRRY